MQRGFNRLKAITPHDTTNEEFVIEELYVGGAGNVVLVLMNDDTVTLTGALAGHRYPYQAKRINSTSTTATNLVAAHSNHRVVDQVGAS
tara:strand:+ start:330 stop:596 length:267 start_codon:yes stop_codon:yes gene_type:complete